MNFWSEELLENKSKYDFSYSITNFSGSHNGSYRIRFDRPRIICLCNRLVTYLSQQLQSFGEGRLLFKVYFGFICNFLDIGLAV